MRQQAIGRVEGVERLARLLERLVARRLDGDARDGVGLLLHHLYEEVGVARAHPGRVAARPKLGRRRLELCGAQLEGEDVVDGWPRLGGRGRHRQRRHQGELDVIGVSQGGQAAAAAAAQSSQRRQAAAAVGLDELLGERHCGLLQQLRHLLHLERVERVGGGCAATRSAVPRERDDRADLAEQHEVRLGPRQLERADLCEQHRLGPRQNRHGPERRVVLLESTGRRAWWLLLLLRASGRLATGRPAAGVCRASQVAHREERLAAATNEDHRRLRRPRHVHGLQRLRRTDRGPQLHREQRIRPRERR